MANFITLSRIFLAFVAMFLLMLNTDKSFIAAFIVTAIVIWFFVVIVLLFIELIIICWVFVFFVCVFR